MPEARMRMYLINLTQDVARWRSVSSQFVTVGLQARRLEAVQGAGLTSADTLGLYSATLNAAQYHKPLLAGEIGCYASHLSAWQQLLDSKEALMAVFEDDIEIDIDLPQVLEAVARLGESWDIVKLIGRSQEKTAERIPFLRGRDLVSYRRVPSLTGAYVITARGAEKLLRRRRPFGRPVDVDMRYWWGMRCARPGRASLPGAGCSIQSRFDDRGPRRRRRRRWTAQKACIAAALHDLERAIAVRTTAIEGETRRVSGKRRGRSRCGLSRAA